MPIRLRESRIRDFLWMNEAAGRKSEDRSDNNRLSASSPQPRDIAST